MINIERLKQAKKQKNMTFEELSQKSKIPLSTIYDIFRGITTAPRIDTMQAIEKALGLSCTTDLKEESDDVSEPQKLDITAEEYDLISKIRKLEIADKLAVITIIERLSRANK